jgi:hypothetical protein
VRARLEALTIELDDAERYTFHDATQAGGKYNRRCAQSVESHRHLFHEAFTLATHSSIHFDWLSRTSALLAEALARERQEARDALDAATAAQRRAAAEAAEHQQVDICILVADATLMNF